MGCLVFNSHSNYISQIITFCSHPTVLAHRADSKQEYQYAVLHSCCKVVVVVFNGELILAANAWTHHSS